MPRERCSGRSRPDVHDQDSSSPRSTIRRPVGRAVDEDHVGRRGHVVAGVVGRAAPANCCARKPAFCSGLHGTPARAPRRARSRTRARGTPSPARLRGAAPRSARTSVTGGERSGAGWEQAEPAGLVLKKPLVPDELVKDVGGPLPSLRPMK